MQKKLKAWAEDVVRVYNPIAQRESVYFYTQSNLTKITERPELLILGINPGSGGKNEGVAVTADEFLSGNKTFHQREQWVMWRRLCSIFQRGNVGHLLEDETKWVWSNVFHFATLKEKGLTSAMKTEEVVNCTLRLIDILRPKRVLCLGKENSVKQIVPKGEYRELIPQELLYATLCDGTVPVYAIPHTSSFYTVEEMELIGRSLAFLFSSDTSQHRPEVLAREVDPFLTAFRKRQKEGSVQKILRQDINSCVLEETSLEKKGDYIFLCKAVQARIATTNDHSVNITYVDQRQKEYPDREAIIELLSKRGYLRPQAPNDNAFKLGFKKLELYGSDVNTIAKAIVAELAEISQALAQLQ